MCMWWSDNFLHIRSVTRVNLPNDPLRQIISDIVVEWVREGFRSSMKVRVWTALQNISLLLLFGFQQELIRATSKILAVLGKSRVLLATQGLRSRWAVKEEHRWTILAHKINLMPPRSANTNTNTKLTISAYKISPMPPRPTQRPRLTLLRKCDPGPSNDFHWLDRREGSKAQGWQWRSWSRVTVLLLWLLAVLHAILDTAEFLLHEYYFYYFYYQTTHWLPQWHSTAVGRFDYQGDAGDFWKS